MSVNSNFYYTYKKRFEEAQKKSLKERAWLLENLAKELLNDLASEWLSSSPCEPRFEKKEYEKEEVPKSKKNTLTKKVFKSRDYTNEFVEVGILNTNNEVIFHKPLKNRVTHIGLYDICFYTEGDYGEDSYRWLSEVKEIKEVTTTVDGLNCSLGYVDHNDVIVFYDQYL